MRLVRMVELENTSLRQVCISYIKYWACAVVINVALVLRSPRLKAIEMLLAAENTALPCFASEDG